MRLTSEPSSTEDDVDLFARLLAAHQEKLYRVAYRMAGHHEDAQDLLQDALLEAYRSFKKFQRGTYFDKWLYRIMTNTFIDRQRHKKRVGRVDSLDAPSVGGDDGEISAREIPDWTGEPSRRVLHDEFGEPVQKALNQLKPDFRMVLILSDVEEFSYEEIAEMLNIPIGTVRSRLHRARDMMRQTLTESGTNK
jgi:RNA polymerase sigma-70 factor (ECF subfamily)